MEKVTREEFDYFMDKINYADSFLDAKAIQIMSRFGTLFAQDSESKSCTNCAEFGKYSLHIADRGSLVGCKLFSIQDSDRTLGYCSKWRASAAKTD